jgi:hypothetical protein
MSSPWCASTSIVDHTAPALEARYCTLRSNGLDSVGATPVEAYPNVNPDFMGRREAFERRRFSETMSAGKRPVIRLVLWRCPSGRLTFGSKTVPSYIVGGPVLVQPRPDAARTEGATMSPSYSMGIEVDHHSNLRQGPSTSSDIVSEVPEGAQMIADPVAIEAPDDPECTQWYAVQYQMASAVTLEGYICADLVHPTW